MKTTQMLEATMALVLLGGFGAGAAVAGDSEASPNAAEAKISQNQAEKIALEKVPGTVKEAELEKEGGKLVWSFDIAQAGSGEMMDVEIDAQTGEVLEVEKD